MKRTVQFDYALLRGRIREIYQSEKNFAEAMRKSSIGMSTGAFSSKINGKTSFTEDEIYIICQLLHIPIEEICKYFFKEKYEFNS